MHLSRFIQLKGALSLLVSPAALLMAQPPSVSPVAPVVSTARSVNVTADRPVLFSIFGYGTLSAQTATTATYQAPASGLYPQHLLNGCMVTPDDSVFNMDISKLPVDANSANWTPFLLSSGVSLGFKWGVNLINNSTPLAAQQFENTPQLDGVPFPVLPPSSQKRQNGAFTTDEAVEHHLISLNPQNCQFYETNQQGIPLSQCPSCSAESGWTYSSTSYALPPAGSSSADLSGLPLAPLTVHLSEFYANHISHALRFTACAACVGSGFRWPATHSAGTQSGAPPVGARFRLKASFNIAAFPTPAQLVLKALQQYGMILAGAGPDSELSFSTDVTEDPKVLQELQTLTGGALSASDFDAVDESSYLLSPASSAVNPLNGFEYPIRFALLTATDAANHSNSVQIPIALQPIVVGTPESRLIVQAGTPAFRLPVWVTGSGDQTVNWTMYPSSGAGTLTASGIYTPPASVNSPQTALLTLASPSNTIPFATSNISLTVIPSGVIRIDSGSPTGGTDDRGLAWLPDLGFETGTFSTVTDTASTNAWSGVSNHAVWQSYTQTAGDDLLYRFRVPNGTYAVQMLFGVGNCQGSFAGQGPGEGLLWGALDLQAQTTLADTNWNFGAPIRFACQTPETASMLAQVSDNTLTLAVRATGSNQQPHTAALLNGLTITPVGSGAAANPAFSQNSSPGVTPTFNIQDLDPQCGNPGYNCRTAIQKAFGLFATAGGGTLTLPAGTFLLDFPELAQNVASAPWFTASSLLTVPPNTTIQGHLGSNNVPDTVIQWRSTSLPIFLFARASHSSLRNLHLSFTGSMPSVFPYGDVMLLDILGYNTQYPHPDEMVGGPAELFSFAFVFDSDGTTFSNLIFDSAQHDNAHIFGTAINLKGKGVIVNGPGGLTTLANGNQISNVQIDDFLCGLLVAGQNQAVISNVSADRRGSTGLGSPGHLLYVTSTFQGTADGTPTGNLENTNLTVQNMSEGPHTYSNANAGGTLAIKSLNGGLFTNITSQHPEGLIQTLYQDQNVTFSNLTWNSSYDLCANVPANCSTPVIYSTIDAAQFYPLENLTFNNISLTSTVTPISALLMGNGISVNGFNTQTPPGFLPNQTQRTAALGVKATNRATVANYTYTPLLSSYTPGGNYNVPFMGWHPAVNVSAAVTVAWPTSIPVPTGAPIITPAFQDANSNNFVSTKIVLR